MAAGAGKVVVDGVGGVILDIGMYILPGMRRTPFVVEGSGARGRWE